MQFLLVTSLFSCFSALHWPVPSLFSAIITETSSKLVPFHHNFPLLNTKTSLFPQLLWNSATRELYTLLHAKQSMRFFSSAMSGDFYAMASDTLSMTGPSIASCYEQRHDDPYQHIPQRYFGLRCHSSAFTARPPIDTGPHAICWERRSPLECLPHCFMSESSFHIEQA